MDPVNSMAQDVIDCRNEVRALLGRQAAGEKLSESERAKLAAAQKRLPELEQAHADERARIDADVAETLARSRARGYNAFGERVPGAGVEDEPGATVLPALPVRTRAALARLYPQASADPAQRNEEWRGVLAAALGGQPLHPAILAATATEGVPSDGGFLVSPSVAAGIFTRASEGSVWLRIGARLEPMESEEKVVNAIDDADETDDAEGGLEAAWKGEGADSTAQTLQFRQVALHARKLVVLAAASNELVEDSRDYVTALEDALGRGIAKKFDKAVLSGTGAGMPLGILNSPATITVAAEGGQLASTFVWENAVDMWAALAPGSHERAWWLAHPTVLPQALSMSLTIGTGGTVPRGALEAGGPTGLQLLGRPFLVTSRVKALGSVGDVILVDPTQIAVGVRRGLAIERSTHAYFSSDRLAVRGKFRGDARPFWEKARTLVDSGGTVSPIVVLAARA